MLKTAVIRRSACDQCKAKRVRCLRAEYSVAPCARCSLNGTRCVTSPAGHPGRPPKRRAGEAASLSNDSPMSPDDHTSPGPGRSRGPVLRHTNQNHAEFPGSGMEGQTTATSTSWHRPDRATGSDNLAESNAAMQPHITFEGQRDLWGVPGDQSGTAGTSPSFESYSVEETPAPGDDIMAMVDQLDSSSHLQGLLDGGQDFNAMLQVNPATDASLDTIGIDPIFGLLDGTGILPTAPAEPPKPDPCSLLMRFREQMDQLNTAVDGFWADAVASKSVQDDCRNDLSAGGGDVKNPVVLVMTRSKELTDIIQSLTPPTTTPPQIAQAEQHAPSTEVVLLALSSYLSLMRLFDSVFYHIYMHINHMPADAFAAVKSMKVKSVLRIGGVSALQDMSLKGYAVGVMDAIKAQVHALENCMGIPADYCLSDETAPSHLLNGTTTSGLLLGADRAELFRTVMAQGDVRSRRGCKSYVESIRRSIEGSMSFLDD